MSTIVDVARRAGVSVSTVSHVVNGTRRVNADTAQLVEEAIAFVGFRPNALARSLKRASTDSVGIAISVISNPYFSDIVCAIEAECARLGLMVFLSDTQDEPARELKVVQALHQRRVDGIILAPSADPERRGDQIPRRASHSVRSGRSPGVDALRPGRRPEQERDAAAGPASGLARPQKDRLCRGPSGFSTARERTEGYKAALKASGIAYDEALLVAASVTTQSAGGGDPQTVRTGRSADRARRRQQPDDDRRHAALRELGLRVPDDVALVGFDDFEWANYFEPRLTRGGATCR